MIKNVIFDIGDVLIDYRWKELLMEQGLSSELSEEIGKYIFTHPMWRQMDRGGITNSELEAKYCSERPEWAEPIRKLFAVADRMPIARPAVWACVERLKKAGYNIYLLSNYSQEFMEKHVCIIPFFDTVDGKVISYQVGCVKPEKEIYECLLNKYNLVAEECIFFDDRQENAVGACNVGIKGVWTPNEKVLLEEISKLEV